MNGLALSNVRQTDFMKMKTILALFVVAAGSLSLQAADLNKVDVSKLPPAAGKAGVTFDGDIKPLFEKSCAKCHGADVEKPKGKFRSDTKANVLKGGGEGSVITPGDASKSGVLSMIAWATDDEEMYMPPKGNKAKIAQLTKEEVALVRAWIEQGAK